LVTGGQVEVIFCVPLARLKIDYLWMFVFAG